MSSITPRAACDKCGGSLRWERIEHGGNERWLGLCECGLATAFIPERPNWKPTDPLRAALVAESELPEPSPPWIRLYSITSGPPWLLPWAHSGRACDGCAGLAVFGVWTVPRSGIRADSELCLGCGRASVVYLRGGSDQEMVVTGDQWTPACVAVARLRKAVFVLPPFRQRPIPDVSDEP